MPSLFSSEEKVLQAIEALGPLSILAFMLLQILQVIITPIPGEVTGLIGGYLYGPMLGTVYSTIGLTFGSLIAFSLARAYGLPCVEKIISPSALRRYDGFIETKGMLLCFLFFIIPGAPKDIMCYVIGLSRMPITIFLVLSTSGRLLGTILLSAAGSSLRNHRHDTLIIIAGAAGVFALTAYVYNYYKNSVVLNNKKCSFLKGEQ